MSSFVLYIINLQPCAFLFYEQILKKVWTSEYDYFSVFVLLIDGECVRLLYFALSCKLWSKWSWSKWSNSKSDERKKS